MSARDDVRKWMINTGTQDVLLDAYRAEILAEAQAEVAAYLVKKAREYRSTNSKQHAVQAEAIATIASKIQRGAIRLFIDAAEEKATAPAATATPLTVSRFTSVIVPEIKEGQPLTISCTAEDGTPVALRFSPEDRAKVGYWLTGDCGPELDDRLGSLADHILGVGGEWTTGKAHAWLLATVDPGVSRHRARYALQRLASIGYLIEHDRAGRRTYTPNYSKADA